MDKALMLGNEAVARAAYEAGATVATAYPGTPSTEITENIAKYNEIYCEWAPNEKVALEVAIGASIAGARAICSMKHVGLNVAADPLFTSAYTGVNGGLVVLVADDPGMHSSQNEQDSRYYGLSAKVPVLEPSDSGECLLYVKEAFKISEIFDTPVIVRLTTRVAHSRSLVTLSEREERELFEYKKNINKYVMMPAMARGRRVAVEKRMVALNGFSEITPLNSIIDNICADVNAGAVADICANAGAIADIGAKANSNAGAGANVNADAGVDASSTIETDINTNNAANRVKLVFITSGISWQYTKEALQKIHFRPGVSISVLKLGLAYPLSPKLISDFTSGAAGVAVIEELSPFMENIVKTYGLNIPIYGKPLFPAIGELSAALTRDAIAACFEEWILSISDPAQTQIKTQVQTPIPVQTTQQSTKQTPIPAQAQTLVQTTQQSPSQDAQTKTELPIRPPVLCPGCPHRSVFYVLKKLKLVVCGDIGCYTLGALPPLQAMDTCVCMGASVSMAHGMDKARGAEFAQKTVAVIGDSTFIHSGITSLLDIIYNKGRSTVLILDNEITGMTGHQENPSTGRTIRGEETNRVDIVKLCEALGVKNVRVEDAFDVTALEKAIREETLRPEPSVIVIRRPCMFLSSYKPDKAVRIDADKCKRCKMCMNISCAAISDKDGIMQINQALCVKCGLCSTICRFGAIVPISGSES